MSESSKRGVQALVVVGLLLLLVSGIVLGTNKSGGLSGTHRPGKQPDLIDSYLRSRANEPQSVAVQSVMYGRPWNADGIPTQFAWVKFREKNQFGATVLQNMILRIQNNRDVSHSEFERNYLAIAHTNTWSENPAGPK